MKEILLAAPGGGRSAGLEGVGHLPRNDAQDSTYSFLAADHLGADRLRDAPVSGPCLSALSFCFPKEQVSRKISTMATMPGHR